MDSTSNNGIAFLSGIIIGSALGIVAGFFLAPKSGRELRADLVERGKNVLSQIKGKEVELKEAIKAGREAARQELRKE